MAGNLPNLYSPNLMGIDPQTARIIRDLADRVNYLTTEIDRLRTLVPQQMSDMAKKENPVAGIITIPSGGGCKVLQRFVPQAPVGTSGSSDTTLHSYTLDPGQLATDGDFVRIWYSGKTAGNTNGKRFRPRVAATAVHDGGSFSISGGGWAYIIQYTRVNPVFIRASDYILNNFMSIPATATPGNASGSGYYVGDTFDVSPVGNLGTSGLVFDFIGTGTANDDILLYMATVELYQQNDPNRGFIRVNPDGVIVSYTNPQ